MTLIITLSLSLIASLSLSSITVSAEIMDVVFMHGLAGWGPEEFLEIGYWGFGRGDNHMLSDESIFPTDKFRTHEASVGPFSSNWDRACELYAQIVGGKVDYGEAHSLKHGHERFGRTYEKGFVEDWGTGRPISLVGHSMGGQTIRMLQLLMVEGDAEERALNKDDISPLFQGGHHRYFHSMVGVSAVNDGTTLVDILDKAGLVDLIKTLLLAVVSATGLDAEADDFIYDFDLDHFGMERKEGERFKEYYERILSNAIWDEDFKDLSPYDLSIEGAAMMNGRGRQAYDDTFYFSVVGDQTHRGLWPFAHKKHYPDIDMIPFLSPFALLIGGYGGNWGAWNDWHANDGLVPMISQQCPKLGYPDGVSVDTRCGDNDLPRNKNDLEQGKWYQMTVNRDHVQVIGISAIYDPRPIFRDIAAQLLNAEYIRSALIGSDSDTDSQEGSGDGISEGEKVKEQDEEGNLPEKGAAPDAIKASGSDSSGSLTSNDTAMIGGLGAFLGIFMTAGAVVGYGKYQVYEQQIQDGKRASLTTSAGGMRSQPPSSRNDEMSWMRSRGSFDRFDRTSISSPNPSFCEEKV